MSSSSTASTDSILPPIPSEPIDVGKPLIICIGVDGSAHSKKALEYSFSLMRPQDQLVLLCVYPRTTTLDVLIDPFNTLEVSDKQLREYAGKQLAQYEKICVDRGISFQTRLVLTDTSVKDELPVQLELLHADLFVVGNRGLGTVSRILLGSVSDYVVKTFDCCSVVVVH